MSRKYLLSAIIFAVVALVFLGRSETVSANEDNTICQGVFIDQVDVSGMTKAQAKAALEEFVKQLQAKGIAIKAGDDIIYSTMGDFGYTYKINDDISQALALGKSGNLIKRYKDLKDIEQGNVVYPLEFTFDEGKIKDLLSKDVSSYNIAPINATVKRENGEFVYTDHVVGKKVNVEKTLKIIADAMTNWNRMDIVVDAVIEDDMPKYTREDVELCNKELGTYTTDFSSSAFGRSENVTNGARLINNLVLYPGDKFSAYEVLTPFTEKNGYYIAGAYLNGVVVDSVGGGACQVTTTLYNAVLAAELEVVERMPHSMTISYVDLSRDAAIAGTYKDFKFANNSDTPILIEGFVKNKKLTFKIWGHETRDTENRKIEYVTKVLSQTNPPAEVVTKDPSKPTTYRKVTQSAHTGYKAELYKVVYENGKEVSRTLVNTSRYQAAPQYVTVGTKKVEEPKKDSDKDDKKDDENDANKPSDDSKPSDSTDNSNSTEDQAVISNDDSAFQMNEWDPTWDFEEPVD